MAANFATCCLLPAAVATTSVMRLMRPPQRTLFELRVVQHGSPGVACQRCLQRGGQPFTGYLLEWMAKANKKKYGAAAQE